MLRKTLEVSQVVGLKTCSLPMQRWVTLKSLAARNVELNKAMLILL